MLFGDDGYRKKHVKSSLIRKFEENLSKEDYSVKHKPNLAYLIDLIASLGSDVSTSFDLFSAFLNLNKVYIFKKGRGVTAYLVNLWVSKIS